jgi:polysaccharide chain length determinant protein (PEP-CTERM system associated)
MMGHRQLGGEDYAAIWRRRRLLIIVPAILGAIIVFGLSLVLPNKFESDTLIIIQRQKIPNALVQPVIADDLNARIATLQQQVLSRTRLEPIIKRYDLFKAESGQPMDILVSELRNAITLTPVKPIVRSRDETVPGFTISVILPSAREAQQVCAEITSMFIEEDLRQREQGTQDASSFFTAQVNDAKRHLDEEDAKLAQFKTKHINELPDETQSNLSLLASLDGRLEAATQAVNRAQQDKTYTESLLAQQLGSWKALQEQAGGGGVMDKLPPQTLAQQLLAKQNALATLETEYTPQYPDIIQLKADIEQLKKKIHDQEAAPPAKVEVATKPSTGEPPQIQQLRSQLHAYDEAIRANTKAQRQLQEQIQLLQSRIQMTPVVEQQYKEITRGHQTAQDFYNDLLKKANDSQMATDLQHRQQGEQFNVMDPANLPEKPTFPNRPLFALGGLGGGLGLGLCLAYLMEMRDKALYNDKDIKACLGLMTLARVPSLTEGQTKKRGWRASSPTPVEGRPEGTRGI